MSASIALDVLHIHRALCRFRVAQLAHGCVLPGILTSIQEENVVSSNVEAAVKLVSLLSLRFNFLAEDAIAVVRPEVEFHGP